MTLAEPMHPANLDFAWVHPESAETLRIRLATEDPSTWLQTVAWLMREARVDQVWEFLTLKQVAEAFPKVSPLLGRRRPVWEHLLRAAHELGRI